MNNLTKLEDEKACEKLSIAYARYLDFGEYDSLAELFTVEGVLNAGSPLKGKESIRKGLFKRSPKLRSRHVLTNIHVELIDTEHAHGISYLSLYRHIGEESLVDQPIDFDAPAAVGHYTDEFHKESGIWKIHSRVLAMAFQNPKYFIRR